MDDTLKFKLRAFVYYLVVEPWIEKVVQPSLRTASWILIFSGWLFHLAYLFFGGILALAISYIIKEYKSGKFIYWYRQRLYKKTKDEKKKYGLKVDALMEKEVRENEERNLPEMPPS